MTFPPAFAATMPSLAVVRDTAPPPAPRGTAAQQCRAPRGRLCCSRDQTKFAERTSPGATSQRSTAGLRPAAAERVFTVGGDCAASDRVAATCFCRQCEGRASHWSCCRCRSRWCCLHWCCLCFSFSRCCGSRCCRSRCAVDWRLDDGLERSHLSGTTTLASSLAAAPAARWSQPRRTRSRR